MEKLTDGTAAADWALVVDALHYSGKAQLRGADYLRVYLLADGFGRIDAAWAREQSFDWSHVRDSSPEAVAAMAAAIRSIRGLA